MDRIRLVIPAEKNWLQVVDATQEAVFMAMKLPSWNKLSFAVREAMINAMQVMEQLETPSEKEIELCISSDEEWIEICVIDAGPGLPADWRIKLSHALSDEAVNCFSGRGLMFIEKFVDTLDSQMNAQGRHVLVMRKRIERREPKDEQNGIGQ